MAGSNYEPLNIDRYVEDIAQQQEISEDTILALRAIAETTREAMKNVALDGVAEGALTRRRAAEIMHVHPITVSRWLTARETEQPE